MKKKTKFKQPQSTVVVYEALQLEAIDGKLNNTLAFFERRIRRWFSKKFSTPLLDTYKVSWQHILLNYYEDSIEDMEHNEVFDKLVTEYLPELIKQAEEEDEAYAKGLVKEQEESIRKKDNKNKNLIGKADEIVDSLKQTGEKIAKARQSLENKPKPEFKNLNFEDEDE